MTMEGKTINELWQETKPRKKPGHPESELQRACVRWFRLQYPGVLLFHIPNGGKRNAREAAMFKAEGVVAGIPDLFLAEARHGHHGLFIEMKAGRNKPTPEQADAMHRLTASGYLCAVCYTFEAFKELTGNYLKNN